MSERTIRPAGTRPSALPIRPLEPGDPHWPELWREMIDPPARVRYSGDATALDGPLIGMVGTRRATPRGLAVARGLAANLATAGWTVVSGLARGIDGAAHLGALDAAGRTVGVMATGCDLTYPAVHRRLRERMQERGCCLTEYPDGLGPRRHHFPRRNRMIAGMVRGLIVVEAPLRSGALLTALLALDYDREVFAVPGPVDQETSRGCHRLLREGAHLVESAKDVQRVLGRYVERATDGTALPDEPGPGTAARWILDRAGLDGVARDDLRARWPGTEQMWQEGMLALELAGLITRLPGGRLARTIWHR